ncbi:hypothetical protein FSP39_017965 [Pinctada imbricata]|uniref:Integrase catalytic domain-containing protein n=1 Tax=Pinctada imbricata TaxID=66713 RepID=A0AA88XG14_PINIB|nr:hypothetical protein FSP39_017965 [Pinctada imbricata]
MDQLKPPSELSFEGNIAENWREWEQGFRLYLTATGMDEKSEKIQVATFLHVAGVEARRIYNTLEIADDDKDKIEPLITKFKEYCEPRKNLTYLRHVFFTRAQSPHESIDTYVTDLKNKAQKCEFGTLNDSLIKDRIVCGITDESCRARLLRENDLTLNKALDICRSSEASSLQIKSLHNPMVAADAVQKKKPPFNKPQRRFGQKPNKGRSVSDKSNDRPRNNLQTISCKNCGKKHVINNCPAFGKICYNCKGRNHYSNLCPKPRSNPNKHKVDTVDQSDDLFLGMLSIDSLSDAEDTWIEPIKIHRKAVNFKLDTGAEANIIPAKIFDTLRLRNEKLKSTNVNLITYDGTCMSPKGSVTLPCVVRKKTHHVNFFVTKSGSKPILGHASCTKLGLVQRIPASVDSVEITKDSIIKNYKDVFEGLGKLPTEYHIEVDPSVKPVIHPPRKIPSALQKQVKEELDRMENLGVITKQDEPTDWVHSMVIARKPGKIRICIDPKDLNAAIKREHYHLVTVEEIAERLPNSTVFSKFDASSGFWHIELDDESSKLLTFNTPFGRYRYLRLPFGITSASEVFSKRLQDLMKDLPGVECLVDDILVHGATNHEHDENVTRMLERCREINLKLNRNKIELRVPEVRYVGHVISKDGLKVDNEKVNAIIKMPEPTDAQGVRRFLGLVQYVGKFIPNLSDLSAPLRDLTKNDVAWHWDKPQQESFDNLKKVLTSTPVLKFYDLNKEVTISVDASSKGLGAVLLQDKQPVAFASRALTETQTRYAQIERELLAVLYGCEKFHHYIYGRTVTIETDHKPLLAIHSKPLYRATPRLQRMLMKLQRYDVKLVYVPGKEMYISDALSRAYLSETKETLVDEDLDINSIEQSLPMSAEKLAQFKLCTAQDDQLQSLAETVVQGWPENRHDVPMNIRAYWHYRDEISFINGLLYKGSAIIIPSALRRETLNKLHESHLGIVKTKQRAREIIFWPGMTSNIEDVIQKCATCNKFQRSNPHQPLIPQEIPDLPWSKVGADLFHFKNNEYLLCVDYYSKYPEIIPLKDMTSATTISALKSIFARHGIPSEVFTDNGPQFNNANFRKFSYDWEFTHNTSSPYYPRSNGQAERCVQTVKNLLKKAEDSGNDVYIALLEYRNSPLDDIGLSPAQLLMNRQLRTKLPIAKALLRPSGIDNAKPQLDKRQAKQKFYHDKNVVMLPKVSPGEIVRMRDTQNATWQKAKIEENLGNRSYILKSDKGSLYRRNREHVLKSHEDSFRVQIPVDQQFQDDCNSTPSVITPQPEPPTASDKPPNTPVTTRSGRVSKKPGYLSDYV